MSEKIENEIVLPLRVTPQPNPNLNPGGDCGACAVSGLTGLSVQEVYDNLNEGKVDGFTYHDMRKVLHRGLSEGHFDRLIIDVPHWNCHDCYAHFGTPSWQQNLAWFNYIRMAMEAGYYAVASVSYDKLGPLHPTDHVVLFCGTRSVYKPHETMEGCGSIIPQVLISCSARSSPDEEWVNVLDDLLKKRGGFNCFLVRPAK